MNTTSYEIVVKADGSLSGGSTRKTSPSKGDGGKQSLMNVGRNPLRTGLRALGIAATQVTALAFAAAAAKKAIDAGVAITTQLTGDYRGQMAWNNVKAVTKSIISPISTGVSAITAGISEYKTNESVSLNRELYGINDYRKGTK